jgi:hypothetical protein
MIITNLEHLVVVRHFIDLVRITEKFIETIVLWNDITKEAHECEHEHVSSNKYFWNILMMWTKYFYNIPMPHKNDMENIFPHVHG